MEDTDLECLQDNLAVYSETGAVSTPEYSYYSYLKIGLMLSLKSEKFILNSLRNGGTGVFEFGSFMIKKTKNGTKLDANDGGSEWLTCN